MCKRVTIYMHHSSPTIEGIMTDDGVEVHVIGPRGSFKVEPNQERDIALREVLALINTEEPE